MKTIYYIVGPTATGKTISAKQLGDDMKLPIYHADDVYNLCEQKILQDEGIKIKAEDLTNHSYWNNPEKFGMKSWLKFSSFDELKLQMYRRLLCHELGDFIIEGFTLSFPSERLLIQKVVGDHRVVILRLLLLFNHWQELVRKKHNKEVTKDHYNKLNGDFKASDKDVVYNIITFKDLFAKPLPYQNDDFTSRKIVALKIPIQKNDVVLDIGCNQGMIGEWCLKQGAKEAHGYDKIWRYLEIAASKGLIPHYGDVERTELLPADVVLCVSTFHYFNNPQIFLDNVRLVCRRLFILEIPILDEDGKGSKFIDHNRHTLYTPALIEDWLSARFKKVDMVGESVPPDKSKRFVYHCLI